MKFCIHCARGFNELCEEEEACSDRIENRQRSGSNKLSGASDNVRESDSEGISGSGGRTRGSKRDDELKDPHSTGRKRAAILFPLDKDEPCEWRSKAYCGGGKYPIIGCLAGFQENRHHGPDKNTLKNEEGNVHRICDDCHNIWHSQNDPTYDSYNAKLKHEPRGATPHEISLRYGYKKYVATREPLTE